jgi:hypothetical protein
MVAIGIVQEGDAILREVARPFDLPAEAEDARRVVAQLHSVMQRADTIHEFTKGMGWPRPSSASAVPLRSSERRTASTSLSSTHRSLIGPPRRTSSTRAAGRSSTSAAEFPARSQSKSSTRTSTVAIG